MYGKLMLSAARRAPVRALLSRGSLNRKVVSRFVAGEDVDAALTAVRQLTGRGLAVTLDYLGEDITDESQAAETVEAYRLLVDRLAETGLADGAEVSVKLSALGQSLGTDGARRSTDRAFALVAHATAHGVDVTFDMEDHTTIDSTLESVRSLRKEFPRVGCVLQSMLFRTEADARDLAHPGSRVRLVKGAYAEPATVAHRRKSDVDLAYVRCLRSLVDGGAYPMVATHDSRLMNIAAKLFADRPDAQGELQMLYGVRPAEQLRRAAAGHTVRVYVPFGTDWYGYFSRRLAERPANLAFFAKSLLTR
ncbi:proline dehydrogenase family protein [Kribbella sp. HUAS MG21]|uniref:proline dehydrogenase n=1 Tax=Kribbella sp. HUAS MG21 TaxID=3160966 RepID=A0AAU7T7V2_9ACTN